MFLPRAVRKAYRKRALETHPDKLEPNASDKEKQEAERQFHRVSITVFGVPFSSRFSAASDVTLQVHEAFEILSDTIKRKVGLPHLNPGVCRLTILLLSRLTITV